MQEHARRFSRWFLVVVVTLFSLTGPLQASKLDAVRGGARLIHTEPSAYEPVVVFEQFGERCMNFVAIEAPGRQSCYQLGDPERIVFEYTRMMTSALFVHPRPDNVLIIGLGGATLPNALHKLLPASTIDTVEIDPAVIRVARYYFSYRTDNHQRVFADDGRAFVERARRAGRHYDIVMLDAFDSDYIPEHLLTVEFLHAVRDILTPDGIVVANSFARSRLYQRETATYAAVFGSFYNLRTKVEGNRVIIGAKGRLPRGPQIQQNAKKWAPLLRPLGLNIGIALSRYKIMDAARISAPPLHD